jgi:hypothetical protein
MTRRGEQLTVRSMDVNEMKIFDEVNMNTSVSRSMRVHRKESTAARSSSSLTDGALRFFSIVDHQRVNDTR